jgi:hypothetical protein
MAEDLCLAEEKASYLAPKFPPGTNLPRSFPQRDVSQPAGAPRYTGIIVPPGQRASTRDNDREPATPAGASSKTITQQGSSANAIARTHIGLDDSGYRRGPLLMVLCRFSAVVAGWRVAMLPDVLGAAPAPTAPGRPPFRVAGTGWLGHAGAGRAHSRHQQARKASFQGQVRLIFSTRARAWRTSRAGRLSSR